MDPIDKMKLAADAPLMVPACSTCRHLVERNRPLWWKCGAQGGVHTSHVWLNCNGNLWEPEPPGFWKRLGDAIIERVKR